MLLIKPLTASNMTELARGTRKSPGARVVSNIVRSIHVVALIKHGNEVDNRQLLLGNKYSLDLAAVSQLCGRPD